MEDKIRAEIERERRSTEAWIAGKQPEALEKLHLQWAQHDADPARRLAEEGRAAFHLAKRSAMGTRPKLEVYCPQCQATLLEVFDVWPAPFVKAYKRRVIKMEEQIFGDDRLDRRTVTSFLLPPHPWSPTYYFHAVCARNHETPIAVNVLSDEWARRRARKGRQRIPAEGDLIEF